MFNIISTIILAGLIMGQSKPVHANEAAQLTNIQKSMIPVAAFTATGDIDKLKPALITALDNGTSINQLKEVLIQMYAYAGFPRSLNAINALIDVLDKRKAKGIEDEVGEEAKPLSSKINRNEYGNKVRNELVGIDLTNNPARYAQFSPAIDAFLKEHLFADIFGRKLLSHQDREIITVSALAAMHGTESQLKAHLMIAHNTGLTYSQLSAIAKELEKCGEPQAANRITSLLKEMPN